MRITRTKQDLMGELLETKRELANVKRELDDVIAQRDKLGTQVRNLTAEKSLWESRSSNGGRALGEMRRQRAETLQALARVLADLAVTPEAFNNPRPSPPKDEAPF